MTVQQTDRQYRHPPSQAALAGMPPGDILQTREMWIASLVNHWRNRNKDPSSDENIKLSIEWVVALTGEMRIRGSGDGQSNKQVTV